MSFLCVITYNQVLFIPWEYLVKNKMIILVFTALFIGCSTEKVVKVDQKALEEEKREVEKVNKAVRVEQDLFSLVGCRMMKNISVTTKEKKKQAYLLKKKAQSIGGNVLNNLDFSEHFERTGETIFEVGDKQYFVSADVYRCML